MEYYENEQTIWICILITLILILIIVAACCNKLMDKWMVEYMNFPYRKPASPWASFNPRAKWENGVYDSKRAYNILFLKIGIKTRWLTDNCNDGWHFCKSMMIVCLCLAMSLFMILGNLIGSYPLVLYAATISFVVMGMLWNFTFNTYKSDTFK